MAKKKAEDKTPKVTNTVKKKAVDKAPKVTNTAKKKAEDKAPKATNTVKKKVEDKTPRVINLFDAYESNRLPKEQGYIVSSFINANTGYSIYEVISYSGVKSIYSDGKDLTFQSAGRKLYILIEPASYPYKSTEPYLRQTGELIPLRFSEVDKLRTKTQCTLYWAKKPVESLSSFTVTRPKGYNISFVFYDKDDLYSSLAKFFEHSFINDAGLPRADSRKGAESITAIVAKTMQFRTGED